VRTGAHALSLLSVPLNVQVLLALENEPRPLSEVRKATGLPPATTMRGHLRNLTEIGVLQRCRRDEFPGSIDLALGPAGRELFPVIRALQTWLSTVPDGQVELGTPAAKSAIKALVEGWSHNIVRAVAARPLSLTELDGLISSLNYPSLERRLSAMRDVGQLAACRSEGRGNPYAATDWLRRAVGPLAAAAFWERSHVPEQSTPIGSRDVEAAFLLVTPLARLSSEMSGTCRLAVDLPGNGERRLAGVVAEVREGEVVSCTSRLSGSVDAAVTGSARGWLAAVNRGEPGDLEFSGERELAGRLLDALHGAFFRAQQLL
jgi:DNA-binding HxlR family transcriptional regulator